MKVCLDLLRVHTVEIFYWIALLCSFMTSHNWTQCFALACIFFHPFLCWLWRLWRWFELSKFTRDQRFWVPYRRLMLFRISMLVIIILVLIVDHIVRVLIRHSRNLLHLECQVILRRAWDVSWGTFWILLPVLSIFIKPFCTYGYVLSNILRQIINSWSVRKVWSWWSWLHLLHRIVIIGSSLKLICNIFVFILTLIKFFRFCLWRWVRE